MPNELSVKKAHGLQATHRGDLPKPKGSSEAGYTTALLHALSLQKIDIEKSRRLTLSVNLTSQASPITMRLGDKSPINLCNVIQMTQKSLSIFLRV